MTEPLVMEGVLELTPDGVEGTLVDSLGCITVITGRPDGDGRWRLTARVVIADDLKLPWEET